MIYELQKKICDVKFMVDKLLGVCNYGANSLLYRYMIDMYIQEATDLISRINISYSIFDYLLRMDKIEMSDEEKESDFLNIEPQIDTLLDKGENIYHMIMGIG